MCTYNNTFFYISSYCLLYTQVKYSYICDICAIPINKILNNSQFKFTLLELLEHEPQLRNKTLSYRKGTLTKQLP